MVQGHQYIISSVDAPVGIVTLNRPKQLNALAGPLMLELVEALEQHETNPAIRAMVVTGGTNVFAAGADIEEMADAWSVDVLLHHNPAPLWDRIRRLTKPLIAAAAGYALGGGCELAMTCDIIVAADTARFGKPEINLGLMPGGGGTQRLSMRQDRSTQRSRQSGPPPRTHAGSTAPLTSHTAPRPGCLIPIRRRPWSSTQPQGSGRARPARRATGYQRAGRRHLASVTRTRMTTEDG
jgi:enoyl-CoA hydratase/carnithine racemase